ncbi:NADH-quinone oxidoreductase subunit NuoG [Buchnera aphidicola]|uniref:NADH-quinone oxidoreductase subunit NuoG n=1 Tax=Buchnera aphidicola TaxID=9 RepID=UPI0031B8A29C
MAEIYVDGKQYNVDESNNLLHACLSAGIDIPYFCWHPILGSVGFCRQCAVKKYDSMELNQGQIVMSCMTPAKHGTIISIKDEESIAFRKFIIELLMTNHPHDCPVCEEGGNCHLQDMTVMTGHNIRRYNFNKRTHNNQYLGPFISHEMNRCIGCYRCTRYYQDYAGGTDLGVFGISNNIYFGRISDGILENEHSGNLVEICPTGVFTDKTSSEHYHRKWDMQYAPSICNYCSIGCNISVGERYGKICKIENRYHGLINHYLICDLGRFGYGYSNINDRPIKSYHKILNDKIILNDEQAIETAANILNKSNSILGIGSNRASIESNFALKKIVGEENFSSGLLFEEQDCINLIINILKNGGIYTPTLREIENYDVIVILGEDLTQVAPRMALSVRQAVKSKRLQLAEQKNVPIWHNQACINISQDKKNYLFITNIDVTNLDDISTWNYTGSVDDQVILAYSIANEIDKSSPPSVCIDETIVHNKLFLVKKLLSSKKPLIISGSHSRNVNLIQAAFNISLALKKLNRDVGLILLTSSSNSIGLGLIGGISLDKVLVNIHKKKYDTMIVMENDLYRMYLKSQLESVFNCIKYIIVIDYFNNNTMKHGTLVLSAANFFESSGTILNYETRAQKFFKVYDPKFFDNQIGKLDSWKWLSYIAQRMGKSGMLWNNVDDVMNSIIDDIHDFKCLKNNLPNASFRIYGSKIARSSHRASGRTALRSNISVHEIRQPQDIDSMFSFSMEGNQQAYRFSSYIPFAWRPGWNSPQAWNKVQKTINQSLLCGDSGVLVLKGYKKNNINWFQYLSNSSKIINNCYVVPYYFLFGSEEITQRTPVLSKKIPIFWAYFSISDAQKNCLKNNSLVSFFCLDEYFQVKIRISKKLKSGQIGLPLGVSGFPFILFGQEIKKIQEIKK